ncbi:transmembrane 4 L6 family member 4 isoform X3 [Mustela lutreola]|uniref:transmembrane 4 L6 family member 4 isoform X3 n=1 Tax=Mustela lutreola TaxID=9666 RepID=UPI002797A9D1|nr:transmembrane 4 L6 family member 4 isoform X3 [Mustela lutreola]
MYKCPSPSGSASFEKQKQLQGHSSQTDLVLRSKIRIELGTTPRTLSPITLKRPCEGDSEMIFPALVFLGLKNNDCCGCCGNESCGKRFAMFASTIFAVIGFLGAGYSFVISAISINKGPKCLMGNSTWGYPFHEGDYLKDESLYRQCLEPVNVVPWNLTLFSILLVVGGIQMLLCVIQIVNGLLGTLCGDCQCCGCCGGDGPV